MAASDNTDDRTEPLREDDRARRNRDYRLDRITLGELTRAFFTYPAIQAYIALTIGFAVLTVFLADRLWPIGLSIAATAVAYPLAWYLVHRYILHGTCLYKSPYTAALWKRIHFDHHRNPNDLRVLFGALPTTVPAVILIVAPIGWFIGGLPGATAALATGCYLICFYEFCHCVQHLSFKPRSRFLRRIKKRHLAHHFHYEKANYGITNFRWDALFGTIYDDPREVPRSPTVFNLGYTEEEARRYPWVARLTAAQGSSPPRPRAG